MLAPRAVLGAPCAGCGQLRAAVVGHALGSMNGHQRAMAGTSRSSKGVRDRLPLKSDVTVRSAATDVCEPKSGSWRRHCHRQRRCRSSGPMSAWLHSLAPSPRGVQPLCVAWGTGPSVLNSTGPDDRFHLATQGLPHHWGANTRLVSRHAYGHVALQQVVQGHA